MFLHFAKCHKYDVVTCFSRLFFMIEWDSHDIIVNIHKVEINYLESLNKHENNGKLKNTG